MLLLMSLLWFGGQTFLAESGKATVYWTGSHLASCNGQDPITKKPPCRRCFFPNRQSHVAHRSLPLGTAGLLCNLRTGRCARTTVGDRGPWGAVIPCSEVKEAPKGTKRFPVRKIKWLRRCHYYQAQITLLPGWKRRGKFDLTKTLARTIRHQAFDTVVFIYRPNRKVALR